MGYVAFLEVGYCMKNREKDGDLFLGSKMMKFKNLEDERGIVFNGVL